ncbi:MAG: LysM peptidoglycan-binding domain-containing protein, partial [Bernardetiaceae bacterium]
MDTTTPANIRVYRVESGDTLFGIAKKHQTTIEELRRLNGDRLETLYLGQEIYLPDPSVHRVQEGETFYEIITRHGLDAETFKKYNQLDSYQLHIGQVLRIPPPTP